MNKKRFKTNEVGCIIDYYDKNLKNYDGQEIVDLLNDLNNENEQLIHLLENQSIIIQELHSELLKHQLKEPIILTKEDLEIMGKAISYYTHGGCIK